MSIRDDLEDALRDLRTAEASNVQPPASVGLAIEDAVAAMDGVLIVPLSRYQACLWRAGQPLTLNPATQDGELAGF